MQYMFYSCEKGKDIPPAISKQKLDEIMAKYKEKDYRFKNAVGGSGNILVRDAKNQLVGIFKEQK
ncbi:MAG: hypothetical protein JJ885_12955 [Muricauda sp.]|nr:hypothetical protein [Allomuricauda sp.]MBO6532719.1 hypothetical protein [Allomuricauda sp.]MBO6590184.1 hypothetical protein [Allomuricauda sp.]MBO6619668.1 hypothetical protein [Allomuricauda sp.]MBO6645705.1 hypothetical protein [Allomuricauda sp.]MBO6748006.1 hypothetical protein [Allomuricauda sp.]